MRNWQDGGTDGDEAVGVAAAGRAPRAPATVNRPQKEPVMPTRMPGRNFLFVPGPTNIPDRVQRAMVIAMEDHRSSKFPELALAVLAELKQVFKTQTGTTILFPSSGTGSWEAALQNCLDPGDRVLAASFGQFSHLWIDMCQRLKFEVQVLDTEWGEGAPVERYRDALAADRRHQIKAVLVTHRNRNRSDKRRGCYPRRSRFD